MDVPTANEARDLSKMLEEQFPAGDGDELLVGWINAAAGLVASLTCRIIGDAAGEQMEEVPTNLLELAKRVIVMKTEVLTRSLGTAAARRRAIGNANLASISAGPWSESYFGPERAAQARMLDPDPVLADLLWALATEECREGWIAIWDGTFAPAATAIPFEWSNRPGGYGPVIGGQEFL